MGCAGSERSMEATNTSPSPAGGAWVCFLSEGPASLQSYGRGPSADRCTPQWDGAGFRADWVQEMTAPSTGRSPAAWGGDSWRLWVPSDGFSPSPAGHEIQRLPTATGVVPDCGCGHTAPARAMSSPGRPSLVGSDRAENRIFFFPSAECWVLAIQDH